MSATLPEQLERAEAGSRELDAEIALELGWRDMGDWPGFRSIWERPDGGLNKLPDWTISIDAALSLVPEGFEWSLSGEETEHTITGSPWLYRAELGDPLLRIQGDAATPALALCAAALRARTLASKDAGL